MMDIIVASISSLAESFKSLAMLALLFGAFLLLIKRKSILSEFRKAQKETIFNLKIITLNVVITTPILVNLNSLIGNLVSSPMLHIWDQIPALSMAILTLFIGDFIAYWRHRFEHSFLLWPSHSIHHSDTAMSWLTLERMHPINRCSTFIIDSSLLILLGLPDWAIILNNLFRHYYGYFVHINLPWSYGLLGKIFVSPLMHQWHHALDKEAHKANYSTIFSIIDIIFGTFYLPKNPPDKLGVAYYSGGGSFLRQMLYPFRPSSYKRMWDWMKNSDKHPVPMTKKRE